LIDRDVRPHLIALPQVIIVKEKLREMREIL
jgi:hypothetical protein